MTCVKLLDAGGVVERKCEKCEKDEAEVGPCPYAYNLYDESTDCTYDCCRDCRGKCADDV